MANITLPFQYLRATLLCSTVTAILLGSVVGCQPVDNSQQPPVDNHESLEHDEHELDEHEHDEHEHDEHELDEHEHDEHEHDEHEHDEHEHDEHGERTEDDDHAGHDHDKTRIVFSCNPTKDIAVFYHNDSEPETAHLLIDGIEYDLAEHSLEGVAGGAKRTYYSELGLDDTNGLAWQVTGDNAVLLQVPLSERVADPDLDTGQPLYTCHPAS